MQYVAEWLEDIGLSEYSQRFADNGIDISVLPHLTDRDLKEIGVLLGHRRKMLTSISRIMGASASPPASSAQLEPQQRVMAERRQVTVLFSDMVDSYRKDR